MIKYTLPKSEIYAFKKYLCYKKAPNLNFIHIGKCGGTTVRVIFLSNHLNLSNTHLEKVKLNQDIKHFLWTRNPISRFVSAFNYVSNVITSPIDKVDEENLNLENALSPYRARRRIREGVAYSKEFDDLVRTFSTANELAESLTSKNEELKNKAQELMNSPIEHINKGLGWYTNNGELFKDTSNIIFAGRLEYLRKDFIEFAKLINFRFKYNWKVVRKNKDTSQDKKLSKIAVNNIKNFYKNTDYKALEVMKEKDLINIQTLEEYSKYD